MAIQDILVQVDNSKSSDARLNAAMDMAESFDAHLTGLFAYARPSIPAYAEAQIGAEILEAQTRALEEMADQVVKSFEKQTSTRGVKSEWRSIEGDEGEIISREGRLSDLLILGQHDPEDDIFPIARDMPDHAILGCGRPVLVVPYTYTGARIGGRIMVAWDGGPMATRALHDALPFLEKADHVTVMVVNPQHSGNESEPGLGITSHLARHGIHVEADHVVNKDVNPGDLLLSRAADMGADLIVSGAYGHSRWKELVLGGVTDHLLEHMPVPVLMSH